jgi:ubiquinone/menaquinone biosynthesis C-methylase UbiE
MTTPHHKLAGFRDIDATTDPDYFVQFLDAASADVSFQIYKRRTFDLLKLTDGARILDIGCGTGDDARLMAALVAPSGSVVAVDGSQAMIDIATTRLAGADLPVSFRRCDAAHLDLPDGSFDACRGDRTFMHLPDPPAALAEMRRVVRPGGRVLVYEVDFETLTVDMSDRSITRRIVNTWCDGFRNGWLGRHVPALFADAGLVDIFVEPGVLYLPYEVAMQLVGPDTVERACAGGEITTAEGQAWLAEAWAARESGRFFSTLTGFIVVGRRPEQLAPHSK